MKKNLLDFVTTARKGYLSKSASNNEDVISLLKTNKDVQNYLLPMYATISSVNYTKAVTELIEYDKSFLFNKSFVLAALKNDITLLELFPHYKEDEDVQLIQMRFNPELINHFPLWLNEKKVIKAVNYNPLVYAQLPEKYKNNHNVIRNAIVSPILYNKSVNKETMFFDISDQYQQQYQYIKLAVLANPKIYQFLPENKKNNARLIKSVLKSCFYSPSYSCMYYQLQYIIPFIEPKYYKKIDNVLWLAKAFEDSFKENDIYFECTMSNFSIFLKNAMSENKKVNMFFKLTNIHENFSNILDNYQDRLYKKDIFPTGLEIEIKQFFSENLPNLSKSLKSFLLREKIEKKVIYNNSNLYSKKIINKI